MFYCKNENTINWNLNANFSKLQKWNYILSGIDCIAENEQERRVGGLIRMIAWTDWYLFKIVQWNWNRCLQNNQKQIVLLVGLVRGSFYNSNKQSFCSGGGYPSLEGDLPEAHCTLAHDFSFNFSNKIQKQELTINNILNIVHIFCRAVGRFCRASQSMVNFWIPVEILFFYKFKLKNRGITGVSLIVAGTPTKVSIL